MTSSVGTSTSPNFSSMPARAMRSFSERATWCSKPEYACTTYQRFAVAIPSAPEQLFEDDPPEEQVDQPEDDRDDHHDDDDDDRGLHRFLARRPHDLAQLELRFREELAAAAAEAGQRDDAERRDDRDDHAGGAEPDGILVEPVVPDDRTGDEQQRHDQLQRVDERGAFSLFDLRVHQSI